MSTPSQGFTQQQLIELTAERTASRVVEPLRADINEIKQSCAVSSYALTEVKERLDRHEEEDDRRFNEVHSRINSRIRKQYRDTPFVDFLAEKWHVIVLALGFIGEVLHSLLRK